MKHTKHPGKVVTIDKNLVSVEIIALTACASCKSKNMCSMSNSTEKIIDVPTLTPENYAVGQDVNIVMRESLGMKAVFLAYVMPFLVCMAALFGLSFVFESELVYGVGAVAAAALYYITLRKFSDKISKEFVWHLE